MPVDNPSPSDDDILADFTLDCMDRARRRAAELDLRVAIAIADGRGRLVGLHVMPRTLITSDAVAIAKAFSSAAFASTTRDLGSRIPPDRLQLLSAANGRAIVSIPGGVPIKLGDMCVGAVGVSGGTADQDEEIAMFAIAEADHS